MKQEDFIRYAEAWENIFLTWNAWTWKSFVVNEFIENSSKKIVAVAPTWVAAINIGGATIHSTFSVPVWVEKFTYIKKQKIDWKFIDILIIDEISMVWCWVVEYIDQILKKSTWKDLPFWWLQVILIWDKKQLPPVIKDYEIKKEYIEEFWWLDFFYSNAYEEWDFLEINLTENKRTTDEKLINGLNKIRENNFDLNDFQILESYDFDEEFENKAVHLMHRNEDVDNFNNTKIFNINWKLFTFRAKVENFEVRSFLTPEVLDLKIGAKVMITKNLKSWLCNWDIWIVVSIVWNVVEFRSERDWKLYKIEREKWDRFDYQEDWEPESIWTFTQFPLKLAYAITVHKSQWLSFYNVIFHHIWSYVAINLVYVALSRARTFKNLFISKKNPKVSRINRWENFIHMTEYEITLFKKWRKKYWRWLEFNQYNFFFHEKWIEIKYLEYDLVNLNWKTKDKTDWKIFSREDLILSESCLVWFKDWILKTESEWLNIISNWLWSALVKFMPWEDEDEKWENLMDLFNLNNAWFIEWKELKQDWVYWFYWSPEWLSWLNMKKRIFWKDFYHCSAVKASDLLNFKFSFRCFINL